MRTKHKNNQDKNGTIYGVIYAATRAEILKASGMTEAALDINTVELSVDYECFCADERGLNLADCHEGLVEMIRRWPSPWASSSDSGLNGLTIAQFFFIWAWELNNSAKRYLDGKAVGHGWNREDALLYGVRDAVSAAKSLAHAKALVAAGDKRLAQKRLSRAAA